MYKVLNGLLADVGESLQLSTAGDQAFIGVLSKAGALLPFMGEYHSRVLRSVERDDESPFLEPSVWGGCDVKEQSRARNFLRGLRDSVYQQRGGSRAREFTAFRSMYQIACLLSKYGAGDITADMGANAIDDFMAIEHELSDSYDIPADLMGILVVARLQVEQLLGYADKEFPIGRHGPGSVAEGRLPSGQKFNRWRLPHEFDSFPGLSLYKEIAPPCSGRDQKGLDPYTSRVCLVPKSWNKCRTICAEPAALQFCQQSLGRWFDATFRRAKRFGFCDIDLHDQSTNAGLCVTASEFGHFATMDLSAASDRLHLGLVRCLFPAEVFTQLEAVRSKRTLLPDGRVVQLKKFGSMGNATTFPVQTIVFWALLVAVATTMGFSEEEARSSVWVYGDDIICPSSCYSESVRVLEDLGLRVNQSKSFCEGEFRESCGEHAFRGVSVKPAYLRTTSSDAPSAISMCATANSLSWRGYERASSLIFGLVEKTIGDTLPYTLAQELEEDSRSMTWDDHLNLVKELKAPQLARVLCSAQHSEEEVKCKNSFLGKRVWKNGYQYDVVEAWGLYELATKRRANVFASMRDMWTYLESTPPCDRDRGFIPGDVRLSKRPVRLSR